MKTLVMGVGLAVVLLIAEAVYAACTINLVIINGQVVTCYTCCSGNVCNTQCD